MTNSTLPFDDIEARLSVLEDDLDQLRNETRHARIEVRSNIQRLARLEWIVQELAFTSTDALWIALLADRKANAIIEYLRDCPAWHCAPRNRNGGSNPLSLQGWQKRKIRPIVGRCHCGMGDATENDFVLLEPNIQVFERRGSCCNITRSDPQFSPQIFFNLGNATMASLLPQRTIYPWMLHTDLKILAFSRSPDQSRRIKKKMLSL